MGSFVPVEPMHRQVAVLRVAMVDDESSYRGCGKVGASASVAVHPGRLQMMLSSSCSKPVNGHRREMPRAQVLLSWERCLLIGRVRWPHEVRGWPVVKSELGLCRLKVKHTWRIEGRDMELLVPWLG